MSHVIPCPSCGVIAGHSRGVVYRQTSYCKSCYKEYAREAYKFWYDKTYKKKRYEKTCVVCKKDYISNQKLNNTCSPECRAERKKETNRQLHARKKYIKHFILSDEYCERHEISRSNLIYHIKVGNIEGYQENKKWYVKDVPIKKKH